MRVWVALGLAVVGVTGVVTGHPHPARPVGTPTSGDLFFTTYQPATVQRATYSYVRGNLHLSPPRLVARLPGADGAVFSPDGHLLVGGGDSGTVQSVDVTTGAVRSVPVGAPASFMLATDASGATLYTSGLPGQLATVPLSPLGAGRRVPITGDDLTITGVAFAPDGTALYTSSGPDGRGNVGLLDLARGRTARLLSNVAAAHGIIYDPFTDSFLTDGGDEVLQLPARDPRHIASELTVPGTRLDQGTVDGHGRVFLASNDGRMVLVDYSSTRRVGDLSNRTVVQPLVTDLDDVAPLVGPGAPPAPATTPWWGTAGVGALVGAFLLWLWPAVRRIRAWRASRRLALPKWDVRRQGAGSGGPRLRSGRPLARSR
jgi:WD40 repeat protein